MEDSVGVYDSWAGTVPEVDGVSGACFKVVWMEAEGFEFIWTYKEGEALLEFM